MQQLDGCSLKDMSSCLLIREEIDLKFFTGMVVAFGFAQKD